jgi:hypothetical protein
MNQESRHDLYPGAQVICVDDKVPLENGATVKDANITEGETYTVRWVGMASHYVFGSYLGVKLEGIDSKFGEAWGLSDAPYAAKRFRPLVKDPLAWARQIAADPNGYKVGGPEGPLREGAPRKREEV